jgi:poly(A) polymerase
MPAAAPPIDGTDIMKILAIGEGPLVGRAKAFLAEEGLKSGRPMTRTDAVRALARWKAAGGLEASEPRGTGRCIGVDKAHTP